MIKPFILIFIKAYQTFVSPLLGKHCRFYPSCSQYAFCPSRNTARLKEALKEREDY